MKQGVCRSILTRLYFQYHTKGITLITSHSSPSMATPVAPQRTLAPSPPITESPRSHQAQSMSEESDSLEDTLNVHDPGFLILPDTLKTRSQKQYIRSRPTDSPSRRRADMLSSVPAPPGISGAIALPPPSPSISQSSSTSEQYDDEQENIPPNHSAPLSKSTCTQSTPAKSSQSSIWDTEYEQYLTFNASGSSATSISVSGGSRSRVGVRSKLGLESVVGQVDDDELTPGRKVAAKKGKARASLQAEVEGE
jgi:hypothetical protein